MQALFLLIAILAVLIVVCRAFDTRIFGTRHQPSFIILECVARDGTQAGKFS